MFKNLLNEWVDSKAKNVTEGESGWSWSDLLEFADFLDTRFLTTDAPEMTAGDSFPTSDFDLSETCPVCQGDGAILVNLFWQTCTWCDGEGRVISIKPDDRGPSPTPSFR